MEPYKLTIEDIDKLQAQGLDMTGVPEGATAEPFELEALGKQLPPMTAEQAGLTPTQATYDESIQAGATPATAPQSGGIPVTAPTPSPAMGAAGGGGMLDLLSQPISQDPFENLSRNQRMMIGFAALKDAGMALQGKEGSAVSGVMKDITLRADMERKRRVQLAQVAQEQARLDQAAQQQARIDALLMGISSAGSPAAGAGRQATPASIEDQIAALRSQIGVYAQLGQMDVYEQRLNELTEQRTRQETTQAAEAEQETARVAQLDQARDALSAAEKALGAATGLEGKELAAALESGDFEAKRFLLPRQAGFLESQAYKDYKAAASKLASVMTFQNLAGVIETGAKLGILSDSDIAMLRNMSGVIDVENAPIQTADTIFDLYGKIKKTIAETEAKGGDDPYDAIAAKYGEKT